MDVKKRFLFLGPTGVGKSSLINILCNDDVRKEFMNEPATVGSTTDSVTKCFTTYYGHNKYAYTDSIGFGDNRFTTDEIVAMVKQLIDNAIIGYNKIYLCVQYGRISMDIWRYLDLINSVFGDSGLKWCTLIFTHCNEEEMSVEKFLLLNKNDEKIIKLIDKVGNVIFGDLQSHSNPHVDTLLKDIRKRLLDQIKLDGLQSSQFYYLPVPKDPSSLASIICDAVKNFHPIKIPMEDILAYMKSITIIKVDNIHYYGECSICLELMYHTNSEITTCGHVFHKRCIADWFYHNRTCPKCRESCGLQKRLAWLPSQLSVERAKERTKR
ncbi:unnamed protein product [Rotaria magnacalcarata]|uniref:RING-type domain-containing protein n=1 Tax=Rotaria magnacalcarata TaxID=392030 RepID=A0A816EM39_9BILA|nr:unnamed protein product [Rotaria magnacalcarata]CAF1649319.1 unnamed protein product [Rotaria magnacalcarata]CAF2113032.1 unnamed protein product [Rotaria magnacalcarata]CAF4244322.1 unnamed protein product [Rotaria magnacalcarata]CAF4771094.1 unnamed protein product [Rotaria magnacalcarata]